MTQNPPDQPDAEPGRHASPDQYGGDPHQSGAAPQQPYGAGQAQSYGTGPQAEGSDQQPYGGSAAQQPYPAAAAGQPGGPGGPEGSAPGGLGGPPPGGRRSNAGKIAAIVIGGLLVLALLVWGAIALIDSRDDAIPTPTAPTEPSEDASADGEPSEDASGETADPPEGAGELYDLLSSEAGEVQDGDGNTWTVQDGWSDASDLSAEAMEAYTATYTSDTGEITMTAISFPDPEAADTYVAGVQDERGDPDYSGDVWQSDNGNGLGTRIDYEGDVYSIYWYDDTAVVYQIDAPDGAIGQDFYGSLPF